jgi:hypothetical protein
MVAELCPLPSGLVVFYQLFSAPRRCYVIQALNASASETLTVRELARAVATAESAESTEVIKNAEYRNVYNALTQTHLSKLAAEEIIEYDTNRKVITAGRNFQTAHRLLALSRGMYRIQELGLQATAWGVEYNG